MFIVKWLKIASEIIKLFPPEVSPMTFVLAIRSKEGTSILPGMALTLCPI